MYSGDIFRNIHFKNFRHQPNTNTLYPPPPPKKMVVFFWGVTFFLRRFNFEIGLFYSAGIHFGVSRIVGLAGWPIALIRPVLLGFEFQFSGFLVFLSAFLPSILALSNVCYKKELFVNNCFVYLLKCFLAT